jgi:hypothetical protein
LLPLQLSNDVFFDGQVNYRTQFEFLYDVLAAAPKDVAVIVIEHPNGEPVLRRSGIGVNLDALRKTFPNMIFLEEFRLYQSPSQFLVPRVDGVWSVSSSVGYQALLFNGILGSFSSAELANVADATTFDDFFSRVGCRRSTSADAFVAWLLERYLVPASLFTDGRWLHDYLRRRLDAARSANSPIDAFVPTADMDRLMEAWIVKAPGPLATGSTRWADDPLLAELLADLQATRADLQATRADLHDAQREINALLTSTSWRITSPLRIARRAADFVRLRH